MSAATPNRRHDLDALRATAMLLGIALHAALSFMPSPWPVQDSRQHELFGLFFSAIHGFRMPLFFVISGFFTAMLWRQRGLQSLVRQRAKRVLLPCLLGLLTIVPAVHVVSYWAMSSPSSDRMDRKSLPPATLIEAIRRGDAASFERFLGSTADLNTVDDQFGVTPLAWGALIGDENVVRQLLERGADIEARNRDGTTAIHAAAFLGKPSVVKVLLEHGANPETKSLRGDLPAEACGADWDLTAFIANLLNIELPSPDVVQKGRAECLAQLPAITTKSPVASGLLSSMRTNYATFITSPQLALKWSASSRPFHPITTSVFSHLWFLWFLCWLLPFFAIACQWMPTKWWEIAKSCVASRYRLLWVISITMLPQLLMGTNDDVFGPDTSDGLIPAPHLLFYYGVFFGFGALYFEVDDGELQLGRRYWALMLTAVLVLLPVGLATMWSPMVTGVVQVAYAWLMTFGAIGAFRQLVQRESRWIRYVSDSSYWLYLAHLPLVILGQNLVRDWPVSAVVKFGVVCVAVVSLLLITYELFVRYTWIGAVLNGRKNRPVPSIVMVE